MKKQDFLYRQVTDYLSKLLIEHYNQENYKFPTEVEIMNQLNVSRITVRKAFTILEGFNLVKRNKRGGTVINHALSENEIYKIINENELIKNNNNTYDVNKINKKSIVFIFPTLTSRHIVSILQAIIENSKNINILIDCSEMSVEKEQQLLNKYLSQKIDGIILYPIDDDIYNPALLQLAISEFPLIVIDRFLPGLNFPFVMSDHAAMVELAVNFLVSNNHRHILYFNANTKTNSSLSTRKDSYITTLSNLGIPNTYFFTFNGNKDTTSRQFEKQFIDYLQNHNKITAIITADYASGLHLIHLLNYTKIPSEGRYEIIYLDFDADMFDSLLNENIHNYVSQNSYRIGLEAINLMRNALEGTNLSTTKQIIPVKLTTKKQF